jgi:hypothetical protein
VEAVRLQAHTEETEVGLALAASRANRAMRPMAEQAEITVEEAADQMTLVGITALFRE